jgi:hypothetical protein
MKDGRQMSPIGCERSNTDGSTRAVNEKRKHSNSKSIVQFQDPFQIDDDTSSFVQCLSDSVDSDGAA